MNCKTILSCFKFPLELDVTTTALNCLEYIKGGIVFMVPVKWVNTLLIHFAALQTCFIKIRCRGKWSRHLRSRSPPLRVVFMPAKRCKCSHICYSLCKMQGHHLAGGWGVLPRGLKSSHDWCMHLGTSDKLEPLLPLQCPGGRQAASWAPGTVRGSCLFAGGREGERGRSCVQRERCRLLDLVSSRFPLTHDRQGALCSTTIETGWNNKAQIDLLCVFFKIHLFESSCVSCFQLPLLFPFRWACVIRRSSNIAAASTPLFQCPFWSVSWRNGDGIFSKTICT